MDLEEFDAPLDAEVETEIEEGKVIRYIEAEGGKEFTIEQSVDLELADLTGCEAVSCLIFVDGSHVNSKVGRRADQCRTSSKGRIHMKKQVGYVQPFIFKEIDISRSSNVILRSTQCMQQI